jgi:SAM-dependent methyltransferase
MDALPLRKHTEVLREYLPLEGARVADVGCGDGALVRVMARGGAHVRGIEPGERQLARARAAEPAGDERYVAAYGEALPLPDGCLDYLVYFNALHHVPEDRQDAALKEAARVLRPGGLLYVQEPLADGDYFEMVQPIDDETAVRAAAYAALKAAPNFEEMKEIQYLAPFREHSFEAFRDAMIAIDPRRRPAIEAQEGSLRQAFLAAGEQRDDGFWFEIPSRLNLLRRQ